MFSFPCFLFSFFAFMCPQNLFSEFQIFRKLSIFHKFLNRFFVDGINKEYFADFCVIAQVGIYKSVCMCAQVLMFIFLFIFFPINLFFLSLKTKPEKKRRNLKLPSSSLHRYVATALLLMAISHEIILISICHRQAARHQ